MCTKNDNSTLNIMVYFPICELLYFVFRVSKKKTHAHYFWGVLVSYFRVVYIMYKNVGSIKNYYTRITILGTELYNPIYIHFSIIIYHNINFCPYGIDVTMPPNLARFNS